MDDRTGDLYPNLDAALAAGVPAKHIVQLSGAEKAIRRIANKVRRQSKSDAARLKKRRAKVAKRSRKRNRA